MGDITCLVKAKFVIESQIVVAELLEQTVRLPFIRTGRAPCGRQSGGQDEQNNYLSTGMHGDGYPPSNRGITRIFREATSLPGSKASTSLHFERAA